MRLNRRQTVALTLGALAALYVLLMPPWKVLNTPLPYTPWSTTIEIVLPTEQPVVLERDWQRLGPILAAIAAVTLGAVFAFRSRAPRAPEPADG